MKITLAIFFAVFALKGSALTTNQVEIIVASIYRLEGGDKAKAPYGILSVKVKGKEDAKRICENTVRNNWRRWEKAGKKGKYFDFLADRYCPPSADPQGNKNWKKNIRKISGLDL